VAPKSKLPPEQNLDARWLQLSGVFCDTFVLDVWKPVNTVRMVFGEYVDEDHLPFFRTAITMPIADAKQLVRVLSKALKEAEEAEEVEAKTAPPRKE
jgi:hypothetical protein